MRTMKIEKFLEMNQEVLSIHNLKVEEDLKYMKQDDGIHAYGPVYINGEWEGSDGNHPIQEVLEFDVLAPNEKLSNEAFHLDVAQVQNEINQQQVILTITFSVSGLIEENAVVNEISDDIDELTTTEEPIEEIVDVSEEFEDLLEDDNPTYTTYRFIVAQENDTYATIAQRYQINEDKLREVNHNKEIPYKTLVLFPSSALQLK